MAPLVVAMLPLTATVSPAERRRAAAAIDDIAAHRQRPERRLEGQGEIAVVIDHLGEREPVAVGQRDGDVPAGEAVGDEGRERFADTDRVGGQRDVARRAAAADAVADLRGAVPATVLSVPPTMMEIGPLAAAVLVSLASPWPICT